MRRLLRHLNMLVRDPWSITLLEIVYVVITALLQKQAKELE